MINSRSSSMPLSFLPSVRFALLTLVALGAATGCVSEAEKRCDGAMKSSQTILLSMNGADRMSVEQTLESLETALTACETAKKSAEAAEITEAIGNVKTHLEKMKSGKVKEAPKPPSAADWAKLEEKGDERCPRGQSYPHPQKKGVMILCRGPSVVEGGWKQNAQHYSALGYQLMQKGEILRAQRGPEAYTFYYDAPESDKAPKCVELETPPNQTWEVAVALATDVDPQLLKQGKPAPAKAGPVSFSVEKTDKTFKIALGDCASAKPTSPVPSQAP